MSTTQTSTAAGKSTAQLCRDMRIKLGQFQEFVLANGPDFIISADSIFGNKDEIVIYNLKGQTLIKLLLADTEFRKKALEFRSYSKQYMQTKEAGTDTVLDEITYLRAANEYAQFLCRFLKPYYPESMRFAEYDLVRWHNNAEYFLNNHQEEQALECHRFVWDFVFKRFPDEIGCVLPEELAVYLEVVED